MDSACRMIKGSPPLNCKEHDKGKPPPNCRVASKAEGLSAALDLKVKLFSTIRFAAEQSDGSQTFEEGQDSWAENSPRRGDKLKTPPAGRFPMHNGADVHFEPPKVPVMFVLESNRHLKKIAEEDWSIRRAADGYKIPFSTLCYKYIGSHIKKSEVQTVVTFNEEKALYSLQTTVKKCGDSFLQ
nr:unnamed protein product [Callosobruchus analis]